MLAIEGRALPQSPPTPPPQNLEVLDEPVPSPPPPVPAAAVAATSAAVPARASFAPRERGFALETGLGLRLASTALSGVSPALQGTLHGGYKIGRVTFGLGLELSATHTSFGAQSGAIVSLMVTPGVRVALLRAAERRFELAAELDIGVGHDFGDYGPGADVAFSLPPGTEVVGELVRVRVGAGPILRYWLHSQLALESTVIVRGDYIWFGQFEAVARTQFDLNVAIGLRLLAVL
jgi:hypothetical protein